MRSAVFFLTIILLTGLSCKKKESFNDPEVVLKKWMKAIETLNYNAYSECEAYPKSRGVFREMYREYYLAELFLGKIEDLDREDIKKDFNGNTFLKRNVGFSAKEVMRKSGTVGQAVKGDVDFIKFIDGKRKEDGWLMSNRTLIRINR